MVPKALRHGRPTCTQRARRVILHGRECEKFVMTDALMTLFPAAAVFENLLRALNRCAGQRLFS